MKYVASLFLVCIFFQGISIGTTQLDTSIYWFRVTGTVAFKKHQSPPGATVYLFWPGPIQGRIPWTHVNKDGTFLFEFTRSADAYHVCAHPGETNGLLPLARTPEEARKIHIKTVCSEDFRLDGQHREQRGVQLKLK
jgi:hypothetical protein